MPISVFYLTGIGLSESRTGLVLTLTLAGDTAVCLALTTQADRIGRWKVLIAGAILMAGAGLAFAFTKNFSFCNTELHVELAKQLRKLDESFPDISVAPTLAMSPTPRETHVLIRGDCRQPGIVVSPGTPARLPGLRLDREPTRLDLARWLVSPDQPLTPRVIVNRLWQEHFGRGIVRTSENFGIQGETPSHPELLDWLASEFAESGWSMKHMHRLMVTSATYRQASGVPAPLVSRDPENALLARQSRPRLTAELIRDSALGAAGLLNTQIGGRSVRPYQPKGASPHPWIESAGKVRYRRGMYIELHRNAPYPLLATFDAPNGYGAACPRNLSTPELLD